MISASLFYICIGLFLSISLVYSRLNWVFKATLVVCIFFSSALVYYDIKNHLGYPVSVDMPVGDFTMNWIIIHEPSEYNSGEIIYWVQQEGKEIRAIRRPYTKQAHEKAIETRKEIKKKPLGSNGVRMTGKKQPNGENTIDDGYDYGFKSTELPPKD